MKIDSFALGTLSALCATNLQESLRSTGNGDDGLQVDQATVGGDTGTLLLIAALLLPNGDDDLNTTGVVVTRF